MPPTPQRKNVRLTFDSPQIVELRRRFQNGEILRHMTPKSVYDSSEFFYSNCSSGAFRTQFTKLRDEYLGKGMFILITSNDTVYIN